MRDVSSSSESDRAAPGAPGRDVVASARPRPGWSQAMTGRTTSAGAPACNLKPSPLEAILAILQTAIAGPGTRP